MRQQVNQGFFKLIYAYGMYHIYIKESKMNNMFIKIYVYCICSVGCHNYLNEVQRHKHD